VSRYMHAAIAGETGVEPRKQQRGGHANAAARKPESSGEGIRVAPPEAIRIPSAHAAGFKEREEIGDGGRLVRRVDAELVRRRGIA